MGAEYLTPCDGVIHQGWPLDGEPGRRPVSGPMKIGEDLTAGGILRARIGEQAKVTAGQIRSMSCKTLALVIYIR